jgi:ribosomal protein S27AE
MLLSEGVFRYSMDPRAVTRSTTAWSFDPSTKTPHVGHCANCGQSVIVLKARIVGVAGDRYLLEGRCKRCGESVPFSV